jgi:DNA mismatch repair protein MutS2
MDAETINLLEFDRVLSILTGYAQTESGEALILELQPGKNLEKIHRQLAEIGEMKEYISAKGTFSCGHLQPVSGLLKELDDSAQPLSPEELLIILDYLKLASRIQKMFPSNRFPLLSSWAMKLRFSVTLRSELERHLTPSGEIKESALPELARARSDLQKARNDVQKSLSRHLKESSARYLIPEPYITQRGDRFVIPVRAEFQSSIPGLVHGSSSSGATVFLEPMETISLNNQIIWLNSQEQRIIMQLLGRLTSLVKKDLPSLKNVITGIGHLDALNACAEFSHKYKCVIPKVDKGNDLLLRNARHPLLYASAPDSKVIPISLSLTSEENVIIISGPNTGGKTAALKTLGLLSMMAQAGLPVPADDAFVPQFSDILADIGDHQSITQNLSSFSSHILRIETILKDHDQDSLVLLDELGRGTDPVYGGALSMAVAETLRIGKTKTAVTTHHRALKTWAAATSGVKNASVRLAPDTLSPTYQIDFGVAGSSSGLEIAGQLGLNSEVILKARDFMDEGELEIEKYLAELRDELKRLKKLEDGIRNKSKKLDTQLDIQEKEALAAEKKREKEYRKQVENLGKDFTRKVDRFLKRTADKFESAKIRSEAKQKESVLKEAFLRKMREEKQGKQNIKIREDGTFHPGDTVYDRLFRKQGILVEINQNSAIINVNGKRISSHPDRLTPVEAREVTKKPARNIEVTVIEDTNREINLVGRRVDESMDLLDKFLDRAFVSNLDEIRVIHGFGTGILKNAVARFLSDHPLVSEFIDEGGSTTVTLK